MCEQDNKATETAVWPCDLAHKFTRPAGKLPELLP